MIWVALGIVIAVGLLVLWYGSSPAPEEIEGYRWDETDDAD